jgi:predicted acetyltransferase
MIAPTTVAVTFRPITADEFGDMLALDAGLFGYRPTPDDASYLSGLFEPSRTLCAFDGDVMVATSAALPLEVTLPGGASARMAGITWVGVRPTHRRRGLMRHLIVSHLEALRTRGELVAGLMASESLLYRRFGFGIASRAARVEVEPRHAALRARLEDPGTITALDVDRFVGHLDQLHTRMRATRNGMVSRSALSHKENYRRAAEEHAGAGPMQLFAHRDHTGDVDGLVSFRLAAHWEDGFPRYELRLHELLGATSRAELALWRLCLEHDLVTRVIAHGRPVDEPIVDLLGDPRRWVSRVIDDLHLRPVDVPELLSARRYARDDALVIEVRDELLSEVAGRFRLEGGRDGAQCTSTHASADLVLGPAELGAVLLGDTPLERLWRAGLVEERSPGAVCRGTAMLSWSPAPWASYVF